MEYACTRLRTHDDFDGPSADFRPPRSVPGTSPRADQRVESEPRGDHRGTYITLLFIPRLVLVLLRTALWHAPRGFRFGVIDV
jgi:hypothetical protein